MSRDDEAGRSTPEAAGSSDPDLATAEAASAAEAHGSSPTSAQSGRPRVFLVDDHRLFLAGVRAELGDRVEVVGEAGDVEAAVSGIAGSEPDVVLLDVHFPGGGGAAVIEAVKARGVTTTFLALSVSDAADDVIRVIRAGARGYVTKTIGPDSLVDAIERVRGGDAVFSPRLAGFVLDAFATELPSTAADPELDQLTAREREVLRLIARGYTYKEIARRLTISPKTVETHVSAVLRKLQLSSRHELTTWANDRRLV
ncbi:MAG TPA: response regulator transcription factor [Acidimicrobiales bacterium]|jgi:DNA-binding NarL/FixJ family response regulator|nr:response regulator transcription factor [Acidimicrobiales bacterium]